MGATRTGAARARTPKTSVLPAGGNTLPHTGHEYCPEPRRRLSDKGASCFVAPAVTDDAGMRSLLDANSADLALLVGNGINRFEAPPGTNSWEGLLTVLAQRHLDPRHAGVPKGVSPTEFYDVLELAAGSAKGTVPLQAQFCQQMAGWQPLPQHGRITAWARARSVPVLTTNFEQTLGTACGARLRRCAGNDAFTAYYPWSSCYAPQDVQDPLKDFAVWHVNGMQVYRQSIRLGLSHYMGSAERARGWLQRSGNRLYGARDIRNWPGANSWLQVFLHKPLLFFGLALGENEVFLRWLLIERAKYHRTFPGRARPGWYVHVKGSPDLDAGKALFLRGVGVEPVEVASFADLYGEATWAAASA